MFPPEFQQALEFAQQIPGYIRLIVIMSVVSVVMTTLVGVGVIVQLNRLINALGHSRGSSAQPGPFSTAGPSTTQISPGPSSTAPPASYGPATNPYGSAGPYGQSGSGGQSSQSPWGN